MKKICSHCGQELGLFRGKTKIEDGWICNKCLDEFEKVGMTDIEEHLNIMCYNEIKQIYDKKHILANKFEKDFQLGEILIVDHKNKLFVFDSVLFEFDNLKNIESKFEYAESITTNTTSKTKKGIGKALIGGMLFGGIGLLAGAASGNKKTKKSERTTKNTYCSCAKIILTLKNYHMSKYFANLSPSKIELTKAGCTSIEEYGEIIEEELKQILENNKKETNSND